MNSNNIIIEWGSAQKKWETPYKLLRAHLFLLYRDLEYAGEHLFVLVHILSFNYGILNQKIYFLLILRQLWGFWIVKLNLVDEITPQ